MGLAVGIDFGTSNSVICVLTGNEALVLPNAEGSRLTPSVVAFTERGEVLVGDSALRQAALNPHRTFESVKRRLGQPNDVTGGEAGYSFAELAALIMSKLKRDAEARLGEPVTDVVLAVPATIFLTHREAIAEAAAMAGLNVIRIIYEPTAAALAYHLQRDNEATILVFDLGGGTFDVSLLEVGEGVVEVKATSGDGQLGGDDWTERISRHLAETLESGAAGLELPQDLAAMRRLREAAESAKIELSSARQTSVHVPYLLSGPDGVIDLDASLTRGEFEDLTADLLERCKAPFQRVIKDAGIRISDIDQVVLVGGATRMPAIAELVRELTGGREPNRGVNPDEVVAVGACLQAGTLKGQVKDVLLLDVTAMSLGIATKGGAYTKLIERNTTIPTKRSEIFTTGRNDQPCVQVPIYQGESELARANKMMALIELPAAPALAAIPQIEVTVDIDANGLISVQVKDLGAGSWQSVTLTRKSVIESATAPVRDDCLLAPSQQDRNPADEPTIPAP